MRIDKKCKLQGHKDIKKKGQRFLFNKKCEENKKNVKKRYLYWCYKNLKNFLTSMLKLTSTHQS